MSKISELVEISKADLDINNDVIPVVDVSNGVTKKVTPDSITKGTIKFVTDNWAKSTTFTPEVGHSYIGVCFNISGSCIFVLGSLSDNLLFCHNIGGTINPTVNVNNEAGTITISDTGEFTVKIYDF